MHHDASPPLRRSRRAQELHIGCLHPDTTRATARDMAAHWVWSEMGTPNYQPRHAAPERVLVGAIPAQRRSVE